MDVMQRETDTRSDGLGLKCVSVECCIVWWCCVVECWLRVLLEVSWFFSSFCLFLFSRKFFTRQLFVYPLLTVYNLLFFCLFLVTALVCIGWFIDARWSVQFLWNSQIVTHKHINVFKDMQQGVDVNNFV